MKVFVAITGASGIAYAKRLVEFLKSHGHDVICTASDSAGKVAEYEGVELPEEDFSPDDFSCPYASGSNPPDAMVVVPCSLRALGGIAAGTRNDIIGRGAEVCLKERKKLVLVIRETPYSLITIKNMEKATLAGAVVLPASPGFYGNPEKVEQLVDFIVGRILDQLSISNDLSKRWSGKP